MALFFLSARKYTVRRRDGSPCELYDLFCRDDWDDHSWLCGYRYKVVTCNQYVLDKALNHDMRAISGMIGKRLYVTHNENGYVSYIKFLDPNSSGSSSLSSNDPAPDDYPFTQV